VRNDISCHTGLGDFYLQPEFLFSYDTIVFSFTFLAGFTFFAAFLTRLSDLVISSFFADAGEILKVRLEESRILPESVRQIESSEEAAEKEEAEMDQFEHHDLEELWRMTSPSHRTLLQIQKEENLLRDLLVRKKKERIRLQYAIGRSPGSSQRRAFHHVEVP
jgi:hypothetical protein